MQRITIQQLTGMELLSAILWLAQRLHGVDDDKPRDLGRDLVYSPIIGGHAIFDRGAGEYRRAPAPGYLDRAEEALRSRRKLRGLPQIDHAGDLLQRADQLAQALLEFNITAAG